MLGMKHYGQDQMDGLNERYDDYPGAMFERVLSCFLYIHRMICMALTTLCLSSFVTFLVRA
ncbi:hypothetical protein HZS_469 [Henneguya salminicola]|nr:hypothetical protein HZS_469 [Henneguya salminicola]